MNVEAVIVGAGAAGIAMARACQRRAIDFVLVDTSSEFGGIWSKPYSRGPMYKNAHLISSKRVQAFSDLAMPESWPDYPHHSLVREYLLRYVEAHGLRPHFMPGATVERVEASGDRWCVTTQTGTKLDAAAVILATGVSTPSMPSLPGSFDGELIHSFAYEGPHQLLGQRVLVIGGRQSAVDIVNEAAVCSDRVIQSTRAGGLFIVPKYVDSVPLEEFLKVRAEQGTLREAFEDVARRAKQTLAEAGIPICEPDRAPGALDDVLPYYYRRGDVSWRPAVTGVSARCVQFEDGSTVEVDLIVAATGYRVRFPFLADGLLEWDSARDAPLLDLMVAMRRSPGLFAVGIVEPFGAHWDIYELQAQLISSLIVNRRRRADDTLAKLLGAFRDRDIAGISPSINRRYPLRVSKEIYRLALRDALSLVNSTALAGEGRRNGTN